MRHLVAKAVGNHGTVDVLVNNVGWDQLMFFTQTDPEFWQKIMSNETCRRLLDEGIVKVSRRGSRTIWETSVYMASLNP